MLLQRFFYRRYMLKAHLVVRRGGRARASRLAPPPPLLTPQRAARRTVWRVLDRGRHRGRHRQSIAMGALYVAAKVEESPRRARDVVNVAHFLLTTRQGLAYEPMDFYGAVRLA